VEVRDMVKSSDRPYPRVMAIFPQGIVASVDRGLCRPGIELRNHIRDGRPCYVMGKAVLSGALSRVSDGVSAVLDPVHAQTLFVRNPGDPAGIRRPSSRRVGTKRSVTERRAWTPAGSRMRL